MELTSGMAVVLVILAIAIVLFITERLPPDLVALGVLAALLAFGVLSPAEALQGFANPTVFVIAALFVVGAAVFRTGLADRLGRLILRLGGASETRLLLVLMVAVAAFSSVISSTGVLALMLPAILSLAARANLSPSRLLIPVAFAALTGGSATLIGTPPNLLVSSSLQNAGFAPFSFFEYTPFALLMLAVIVVFMLVLGRRVLPARKPDAHSRGIDFRALVEHYGLDRTTFRVLVPPGSALAGLTIARANTRRLYDVSILSVQHGSARPFQPGVLSALATTQLAAGDVLLAHGTPEAVERLRDATGVEVQLDAPAEMDDHTRASVGIAEVMVLPRSEAIGKTLTELEFGHQYRLTVLRLRRGAGVIAAPAAERLELGDVLVVTGTWSDIFRLGREAPEDYIVLGQQEAEQSGLGARVRHAPLVLAVLATMVLAVIVNPDLLVLASLVAAIAVVAGGALSLDEAYTAIDLKTIVLIGAMIPLSTAMAHVGLVDVLAAFILNTFGSVSPLAVLAGLFLITAVMTQMLSNTVTTVLLAPIALSTAMTMGVRPQAFLMAIAIASALAFATPIGTPVNALIMTPGEYRFTDYTKVGIPLILAGFVLAMLVLPLLFPFGGA